MKLHIKCDHQLGLDELRRRVDERVAFYVTRYPNVPIASSYRWHDANTAVGAYKGGEGTVKLHEGFVTVELTLPFIARAFRSRIEEFVRKEMDAVLKAPAP